MTRLNGRRVGERRRPIDAAAVAEVSPKSLLYAPPTAPVQRSPGQRDWTSRPATASASSQIVAGELDDAFTWRRSFDAGMPFPRRLRLRPGGRRPCASSTSGAGCPGGGPR